jgi:hypothetical protein
MRIHNVFHVSLLKKYVPNLNHVIDWNVIQLEHEEDLWVVPVCILDRKVKVLKNKAIDLVDVQWMWEHKESMREACLQIFVDFEEN